MSLPGWQRLRWFCQPSGFKSASLALLAGGALTLAFAPFGAFPLAIISLIVLLCCWQTGTPRQAAWRGFLFGLGHYASGVHWVYISLHHYGHAPALFAILVTALLIVYMAAYPALVGYLLRRCKPRLALSWLLIAPALWGLSEWVRSWLFTGFPWLALGYSQIDSPLAGLAPILGVFAVGWAVMLSAVLLLMMMNQHSRLLSLAMGLALLLLWSGTWGLQYLRWTESTGTAMRISMVQGNIDQTQKFKPEIRAQTLQRYAQFSIDVLDDSDLIIWPETAIPMFFGNLDERYIRSLEDLAQRSQAEFLAGTPTGDWESGEFYNAVVQFGRQRSFYHKRHLLPFGEYLPMRALFNAFHRFVDIPMADFTPGADDQELPIIAGHPVAVSICFEAAFGHEVRRGLPQAQLLVNVSNDAWFGDSLAAHQHLQIARMRALEMQRPMARSTNTGISALINHHGQITAQGRSFIAEVLQGALQPRRGTTPYVVLGDGAIIILLSVSLALGLWLNRKAQC